jgi:hypothetical protein
MIKNMFKNYFFLPPFEVRCKHVLSQIIVSEQDILDMISNLDANKAVGPDIISNKMLIAVKVQISKPLCMLLNKSLHQNIFPTDWKLAHVIPLFKAGDKSFPSNYRPVSLFSCVSKLLEKNRFSTKSHTIAFDLLLLWMLLPSNFKDENIF